LTRPILDTLWPVAGFISAAYLAVLLFLFFSQERLLYYPNLPSRALTATPAQAGLAYEPVTLSTSDGLKLKGWFLPAEPARATLLFFHGNAGNISHRLDSLQLFNQLQLSVLIFDYRGYGESEGTPSEPGTYKDAQAAWRYLTRQRGVAPGEIILFGRSLGAAIAADLATRHSPLGLVLESTFTSVPDMAAALYPLLPARWLSRYQYNTLARLKEIDAPLLIIHSPNDEIIPFEHGLRLFQDARQPKQLLQIAGGHNDGFWISRTQYLAGWEQFIQRILRSH